MTINRHNYEEFFLLYVDNELTVLEKKAVENFVIQNAGLAHELEMLQQATLSNNTIEFADKELLFKQEKGISLANYEEYFLLSADDELNEQQKNEVENFVLKHPQLQNEFTLLQQTKSEPEKIVFARKKTLFRHEKKEWKITPAVWMRMSAAAAIIGIVITTFVINRNENNNNSAILANIQKKQETASEKNDKPLVQKPVTEKPVDSLFIRKNIKNNWKNTPVASVKHVKVHSVKNKEIKSDKESFAADETKTNLKQKAIIKSDSLPIAKTTISESKNAVAKQIKVKPSTGNNDPDVTKNHPGKTNDIALAKQIIAREQPVLASHAVYLETDNDEEDKTVYIGSAEINKNKLKGLFKKASVFFNKKIRRNDD